MKATTLLAAVLLCNIAAAMSAQEKALCRNAIADYKKIREIVQLGDLYRITELNRVGGPHRDFGSHVLYLVAE